jgi:HlyD family secretion protein
MQLEEELKEFKSGFTGKLLGKSNFNPDLTLGNIQSYYASFLKRMEEYEHFRELDYYHKRIESLKDEKQKYESYYNRLQTQKEISKKEYELAYRKYQRDSVLFKKEVIPEAQYEQSESQLLQKKYALEQNQVTISNARIQLSKIEQNILGLQLEQEQQRNQLESNLMEAYDNLRGAIDSWKKQYFLVSPVEGRTSFTNYWSKNQFVQNGKRVMTIVPENEGELIGKMTLGFQGAGKVKTGQTVNIKFRNYPYLEYGMVKGIVQKISEVPEDNVYMVEVDLPNGLTTFYGEKLEFHQQMMGEAEIITQDIRLLEKIVRPLRYVLHKNLKEN